VRRREERQSGHDSRGGLAENQGVTNRIQSLLGVEYPVVQAPMTYIARAELAAAVSEGGGMGMIETLTPTVGLTCAGCVSSPTARSRPI
jgi:hypothetical protein